MTAIFLTCWAVTAHCRDASYKVVGVWPHDSKAFTQGLVFADGALYESTGLYGRSSLRMVDIKSGRVLRRAELDPKIFGEGLALWDGKLVLLTWQNGLAMTFDRATFAKQAVFPLETEGWGLAATPRGLVSSDGGSVLTWRDPATFKPLGQVRVTSGGAPVTRLNELEWVEGFLFANIWHEDRIAIIAPATGRVAAWLDLSALRLQLGPVAGDAVLNGMAYDERAKRLYVTGKLWPKLFELELENLPSP